MTDEEKEFKYQDEFNLCINRLKEVFPKIDLSNLERIDVLLDSKADFKIKYDDSSKMLIINSDKLDDEMDVSRLIMSNILEVVSTNDGVYGLNGVESLNGLNEGVSRVINNLLIYNEEDYSDLELLTITNILIGIVGSDLTIDSFFNQNGERFYQKLVDKLGRDNTDKIIDSINNNENCADIENLISRSYLQDLTLGINEVERFKDTLLIDISLLPDKIRDNYEDCIYCGNIIDDYINKRASADDLEIMINNDELVEVEELDNGVYLL